MRSLLPCLLALLAVCSGTAADFLAPGLSTTLDAPPELVLENPRVLTEEPLSDGRVLLEALADVRNAGDSTWENLRVSVPSVVAGVSVGHLTSIASYGGSVAPGTTLSPLANLQIVVNATDLDAARTELLAGTPFRIYAEAAGAVVLGHGTNLVMDSPRIVAEIPLASGRRLLEFAADLRNVGNTTYSNLTLNLDATLGTVAYRFPLASTRLANQLAPFATATGLDSMLVAVASNEVAAVRSALSSGNGLTHSAAEMWVYAYPPKSIDQATEVAWRWPAEWADRDADLLRLVFTNSTPFLLALAPGDLLVENPTVNSLAGYVDNPADPFDDNTPVLADYVPFLVSSVTLVSNEVHVVGQQKILLEVLRSATFVSTPLDAYDGPVRDPYNPNPEVTLTRAEKSERALEAAEIAAENPRDGRLADLQGMVAIPWHFNETFLSDKVKLSGELLFRQSGLKLEVKVEDFEIERVVAHIDAGVVFNLLIECGEKEDTTDDPPDKKSLTLFELDDLPAVVFNLGGVPITIKPVVKLQAGVEANIPTSLTLPLQSSFTAGLEMGYDRALVNGTNDGFFYRPITEFVPVRISDPTVFDELAASLGFWSELDLGLEIGTGSGVSVQAGPSVGLRLQSDFQLAPLADPWWKVDTGLDVLGRFNIDLDLLKFAAIKLVDTSASLHHFDLFHRDAGGPLLGGGSRLAGRADTGTAGPRIGNNVRWAHMIQPRAGFEKLRAAYVFALPGAESDFVAGGHNGAFGFLARFSPTGDVVWMNDTYPHPSITQAAPVPDGGIFTAGYDLLKPLFARYEPDGRRTWATTVSSTPGFDIQQLAAGTNRAGLPEYFAAGAVTHTTIRDSDPAILKLDAQGQVVWSRYYQQNPGDDELRGITVSADGNLLVCGYTAADVMPPARGTPDAGNILKNATAGGLLMKVSSETGEILWTAVCPARWGLVFTRVVEAPDGSIYVGGAASRIITQERPANFFGKFAANGTLIDHVLVGDDPGWPDELPTGGSSPYDSVTGLHWTPEGVVACGQTGLGTEVSGWVVGLTEELGVRFFSVFDGPGADPLLGIADVGDGLAVIGNTLSPYPLPNQQGAEIPILLKLPWEGMLRFRPDSGKRSLFLQPRVYHSSATDEYQVLSRLAVPEGDPVVTGNAFGPVSLVATPLAMNLEVTRHSVLEVTNATSIPLEFTPTILPDNYFGWAVSQGLPPTDSPTDDADGDGLSNLMEGSFARDPKVPDTIPILAVARTQSNAQPTITIAYTRALFARSWGARIEASDDLRTWAPAAGATESVTAIDARTERVILTVTPPNQTTRFFRAGLAGVDSQASRQGGREHPTVD